MCASVLAHFFTLAPDSAVSSFHSFCWAQLSSFCSICKSRVSFSAQTHMLIKWKWQVKSNKRRVPETCEWKPWNHSWLQQKDLDASTKDPQTLDPGPGDCSGAWGQTDRQTDNHSDRQTDSCLTFRKPSVRRTLWRPQPPSYGSVDLFLPSLQADWRCRNRSDHNSLTAKRPKCTSSGFWFVCKNIFKSCSLDWVQGAESDKK